MPKQPKDTSVRDQEFARLTGKGQQPAQGAAPAGGANPQDIAAQIKQKEAELADLKNQQKQAQKQPPQDLAPPPQTQPGIGQASNGNNAAATATEPSQTGATAPTNTASKQADPNATPQPNAAPAEQPAPTQGADNQVAQKQTQQKVDPAQLKANLAKNKNATAKSGFNNYVAGGKGFTAGPNGEPVKKVARESIDFYSSFLGQKL